MSEGKQQVEISEETKKEMAKFFLRTSIPRMLAAKEAEKKEVK